MFTTWLWRDRYAREKGARVGVLPTLDFGETLPRMTQRTLRVTVHSLSGISSDVGVVVQQFATPDSRSLDDVTSQLEMQAVGARTRHDCEPSAPPPQRQC